MSTPSLDSKALILSSPETIEMFGAWGAIESTANGADVSDARRLPARSVKLAWDSLTFSETPAIFSLAFTCAVYASEPSASTTGPNKSVTEAIVDEKSSTLKPWTGSLTRSRSIVVSSALSCDLSKLIDTTGAV